MLNVLLQLGELSVELILRRSLRSLAKT